MHCIALYCDTRAGFFTRHGWGLARLANLVYILLVYVMGDIESTMTCYKVEGDHHWDAFMQFFTQQLL